ncbi:hypothetical protein VCHA31O73_360023 [Vibrio chagasii]|nr:hypothetical protein VCHA31O73_360023 [Vibrio chagasii]
MKLREPDMAIFSKRIKWLRNSKGLKNLMEAAEAIGIKTTTYGKYESGYRFPRYDGLIQIVNFFDVCPMWLLGCTDDPKNRYVDPIPLATQQPLVFDRRMNGLKGRVVGEDGSMLELSFKVMQPISD